MGGIWGIQRFKLREMRALQVEIWRLGEYVDVFPGAVNPLTLITALKKTRPREFQFLRTLGIFRRKHRRPKKINHGAYANG